MILIGKLFDESFNDFYYYCNCLLVSREDSSTTRVSGIDQTRDFHYS